MGWGRKDRDMKNRTWRIPMSNLQLFTEPGGDGGGANGGNGAGAVPGNEPENNGGNKTLSFEEFLALEGNQAEFDRRVQKAVNTAVTNAQTKWKALTDDKLSEAEKLAQMTKEEKAEYKANKLEKELEDLKRQNARSDIHRQSKATKKSGKPFYKNFRQFFNIEQFRKDEREILCQGDLEQQDPEKHRLLDAMRRAGKIYGKL